MTTPLPSTHRSKAAHALEMAGWGRRLIVANRAILYNRRNLDLVRYQIQLAHQHIQAAPRLP